ncbi:MAG: hypothetical protein ACM3MD_03995 [Betaproteobacteria bacterium]
MDGLDLLRQLKAHQCTASVIIMTGWGTISSICCPRKSPVCD